MTATATRSLKPTPKGSTQPARHAVGDLFTARVIAILPPDVAPDAAPHAFLVKFANSVAYFPARNLKCADGDRFDISKKVRVGDSFEVTVSDITGSADKPKYEVSEKKAAALVAARSRIGELVTTIVRSTERNGVLIGFEKNLQGFILINELGSLDQQRRCSNLRPNHQVKAVIQNVIFDPLNKDKFRYELSELQAELRLAAEKVGERVQGKIVALLDSALKLVLPTGVEAHLSFDDFNGMPVEGLEFGHTLDVVIKGIIGNSLSVSWKAK